LKSCDFYVRRESQSVFSINWLIGTRRQFAFANDRRESPHKLPVSIFKERPQNQLGEPRIMRHSARLSTAARDFFARRRCLAVARETPGHCGRARSIARRSGPSTPGKFRRRASKT
jgi:hypothetical protein